ncbi:MULTISPECIES: hypothetical protein [Pseudanabaena]|uniref:Uncharacterized protein n=2 Tax=Pseudanabaena TaxID=1152 RepID=L8MWJ5_9CYAN|nr:MULTISPECIES: hypothetical protein [Pseudanabaena]ELS32352.1 hypothetical protein Pse7429DRAFT_2402 [Pseudanabaena biceps PCC 7429]MDG3495417.1 hypothetical protein [Pseudanabaena catenata USMAC16]
MRKLAARSLITITAITTAMLAVATAVRSQTNQGTSIEISRPIVQPEKPEISSSKKASFVKMFEDIAIAPNFAPKTIELRGISGGGVETQKTSKRKTTETGECIGFIDSTPDHKITLTKAFRYLKLQVKSSGDTIMLVRGPGGIWCSDDVSDRNPEISGDWLEGTYEVWIGSYEENTSFPYLLQLTEQP